MKLLSKQVLLATVLCATAINQVAFGSEYTTWESKWIWQTSPAPSRFLIEPGPSFCFEGGPCVAPWTSLNMPLLTVGQIAPISTNSSDFNFYLGNTLSGTHKVSLSPTYVGSSIPAYDELRANLATSDDVFGTTSNGELAFSAITGTQYYLMLSGLVRGEETYSLSVSAVPEPSQYLLLSIGLAALALCIARAKQT